MATDKTYNGWSNYETWNVKLWMDNEQSTSEYGEEQATEAYRNAEADSTFTRAERATLNLSDTLKEQYEEAMPDLGASVWADLLSASMSEVNWHEIAEHMISDIAEDIDKEEAEEAQSLEDDTDGIGEHDSNRRA